MKLFYSLIFILIGFTFYGCNNSNNENEQSDALRDEINQQQEELKEAFSRVEEDIDDTIDDLRDELDGDPELEDRINSAIADLEQSKKEAQEFFSRVDNITEENVDELQAELRSGLNRLENEVKDFEDQMSDLFDKDSEKENG